MNATAINGRSGIHFGSRSDGDAQWRDVDSDSQV